MSVSGLCGSATGVVGQIAVQGARLLGAKTVVGAARDRRALARARDKLGADAIVPSGAEDGLPERFTEVAGGPVDLVIDPTWGPAAAAAIDTLRPGGRPVQIANASAATTEMAARSDPLAIRTRARSRVLIRETSVRYLRDTSPGHRPTRNL